jgi:hypothetical protein
LRVVTDVPALLEVEDEPSECTVGKTGAERSDHRFVSEVENGTKMNVVEPPDELTALSAVLFPPDLANF